VSAEADRWSRWVLGDRDAGDPRQRSVTLRRLAPIRDRVLAHAEPLAGATLLDVGTGDGLIGVGALDRVGPAGRVVFSDVSAALLDASRRAVDARGLLDRASFVVARAEDLAGIPDRSVDVITARSVLIYVADKAGAFAAMRRALRPGGRISLFEPVNRLMFPEPADRLWGYDVATVAGLADRVKATYDEVAGHATRTMVDFDDRDLVRLAETAGFEAIQLECHIEVARDASVQAVDLDALLDTAPNPLAPTLRECVDRALAPPERTRFLAHLGRARDEARHVRRSAVAYLVAAAPAG
jgi:arsenite methyltransferase